MAFIQQHIGYSFADGNYRIDTSAITPQPTKDSAMGNSASVTVGNIKLSIPEAAQLEDQIKAMPEVKAYRERQAKEAEERRIKIGDTIYDKKARRWFAVDAVTGGNYYGEYSAGGTSRYYCNTGNAVKLTPDEIATLNRITSRMGE